MKKITSILLLFTAILISSCEGPVGPPGQDGDALIGTIFEKEGDFTAANNYELYFNFPNNFEIYDTDVVLVYILWETTTVNGNQTDVWRLMPQSRFIDDGVIQYNFDYTVTDVRFFLETTFDYADLLPAETDNQVFRIAVLPADFLATKKSVEINDLNVLMNSPELKFNVIDK
ncbi:MAG: collagen-like protein [Draconibacterium sp.]|nr:collagen-like protein [Draconibacterium sp.]